MKGSCCDMEALQKHASKVYTEADYRRKCYPFGHWSICHPELYWKPFRKYVNIIYDESRLLSPLSHVITHGWRSADAAMHLISIGARCDEWEYNYNENQRAWIIEHVVIHNKDLDLARKLIRSGVLFDIDFALSRLDIQDGLDIVRANRLFRIDHYRLTFHNNVKILQLIKGIWDYARSPTSFNRLPKQIVAMII